MSYSLKFPEGSLLNIMPGFHLYVLKEPFHIEYAGKDLCEMTLFEKEELISDKEDRYLSLVHPSDREGYLAFLKNVSGSDEERKHTHEYRLIKKNGKVIYVRDTMTCVKSEEGIHYGLSVLADITDIKRDNSDIRFLNDSVSFGIIRYTCEKQPQITYMNKTMESMLRFPETRDGEIDCRDMYLGNIFLMIPMEERRRFSENLEKAYSSEKPLAGEMSLICCDGTRKHVFGWITRITDEDGKHEFQSVCMDMTERYRAKKDKETKRYLIALTDVYDKIFEFNTDSNTVKCLHCEDSSSFKQFEGIAVQMEDAVDRWIINNVDREDQERVRDFFRNFSRKQLYSMDSKPPQITYMARSSTGEMRRYSGIFINISDSVFYYCLRLIQDPKDNQALESENIHLKENMTDLLTRFSDGLAAFEISYDGKVKPLYASENVYEFFGYTNEEWIPLTEKFTPVEVFVENAEASLKDIEDLLRNGEAEFSYYDYSTEMERKIRAVCSKKSSDAFSSRYIMLYASDGKRTEVNKSLPENRTVSIRTFGYFDVFVGDRPIAFRYRKSKELLALLIDRKGGFVSSDEAIGCLWEDEPVNTLTLSRYRKVALRLKNTLEEYGIQHIMESVDGKRRIIPDMIRCDLYDYLSGKEEHRNLFRGSYLTNYSWAELTLGELTDFHERTEKD